MTAETEAAIRRWAAAKHLPEPALARWLALDVAARGKLLALAQELHLRTAQLANTLELLDEIALREHRSVLSILKSDEVNTAAASGGSGPARASRMLGALRALRFPRLTRIRSELEARIHALRIPPNLRVRLPRELSSDELTLELRAASRAELDAGLKALERIGPDLARIVERLGGSDEA
jgi:hypothetical protein